MYSVVLMMALSGSADTAEFGGKCRCSCTGYSCHGRSKCHACHGRERCHGCRSSCHARRSCHACHGRARRCHGYYACHGCTGAVVACTGCTGKVPAKGPATMPKKTPPPKTEVEAPAIIQVSLPADAKLTVDGNATTSTSTERTLFTPALPRGEQFQYTLRAEVVRDGRTVVETQQITVRGGEEIRVPFNFSSNGVASAR